VSADAANNASSLILRGDDLQALADDPEDLQADLMALAGPSAGPRRRDFLSTASAAASFRERIHPRNPNQSESLLAGIRQARLRPHRNPSTKPGTDKFHGTGFYNFCDSFWIESRNPYAQQKAPFVLKE